MRLVIARNPDPDSSLPYLLWVPIDGGLVFRTKGTWPRTSGLYCHLVVRAEMAGAARDRRARPVTRVHPARRRCGRDLRSRP